MPGWSATAWRWAPTIVTMWYGERGPRGRRSAMGFGKHKTPRPANAGCKLSSAPAIFGKGRPPTGRRAWGWLGYPVAKKEGRKSPVGGEVERPSLLILGWSGGAHRRPCQAPHGCGGRVAGDGGETRPPLLLGWGAGARDATLANRRRGGTATIICHCCKSRCKCAGPTRTFGQRSQNARKRKNNYAVAAASCEST